MDFLTPLPIPVEEVNLHNTADRLGIEYFIPAISSLQIGTKAPFVPASGIKKIQQNGWNHQGMFDFDHTNTTEKLSVVPDPKTLIQCPWKPHVGWLNCFLYFDGKPSPQCPRAALIRQIWRAKEKNMVVKVGTELEFTLLKSNEMEGLDEENVLLYQDPNKQMEHERFLTRVMAGMETLGWGPYQVEHEFTANQYEINFEFTDALEAMDRLHFLKFMIRSIAKEEDFRVTFMPMPYNFKPFHFGNGLHFHISLWSEEEEKSIMIDESHELGLSTQGRCFLGGLLKHIHSLTAVTCPTVNSYKRLHFMKNFWNIACWAVSSRYPAMRIVREHNTANRIELRFPDPSANPYLTLAAIIGAGLNGIDAEIEPDPKLRVQEEMYQAETPEGVLPLPRTLEDALKALRNDHELEETIGKAIVQAFLTKKDSHVEEMRNQVTPLEFNMVDVY